jgi:hypothetical protein
LRLERAHEHFSDLWEASDNFCAEFMNLFAEQFDHSKTVQKDVVLETLEQSMPKLSVPSRIAILVGETVYNYRAALDYVVGELSRLDTPIWHGRKPRRNQFPIESSPIGFQSRRETFLAGVNDRHVSLIERFQPYRGCQWTATLAHLSNADKHNRLVVVNKGLMFTVSDPEPPEHPLPQFEVASRGLVLDVGDNLDAVEMLPTLETIADNLVRILWAVRPDFN